MAPAPLRTAPHRSGPSIWAPRAVSHATSRRILCGDEGPTGNPCRSEEGLLVGAKTVPKPAVFAAQPSLESVGPRFADQVDPTASQCHHLPPNRKKKHKETLTSRPCPSLPSTFRPVNHLLAPPPGRRPRRARWSHGPVHRPSARSPPWTSEGASNGAFGRDERGALGITTNQKLLRVEAITIKVDGNLVTPSWIGGPS